MPLLQATDAPYTGAPTVTPETQVPRNTFDIRAGAESFGALQGAATEKLGRDLAQAGNTLAGAAIERQNLYNQIAGDDATNKYQEFSTTKLHGDPNNPADTGFMGLRGEAAMRAYPEVAKSIIEQRNTIRANLSNDRQRLIFDQETRRAQLYTLNSMGQHYDQQMKVYGDTVATAKINNGVNTMSAGIASGNEAMITDGLRQQLNGVHDKLKAAGLENNPEAVKNAEDKIKSGWIKETVENLRDAKGAWVALQFLDNHKDMAGDGYNQLRAPLVAKAREVENGINSGLLPRPPEYKEPKGLFAPGDATGLWDRMKKVEDGLDAQGRAKVSPKGAVGVSQILPETAQIQAAKIGETYDESRLYTDNAYNERLGKAALDDMLLRYNGNEVLAAAAYNAGPGRVDEWIQRYGDPRTGKISNTQFASRIPFNETRSYVQKIFGKNQPTPGENKVFEKGTIPTFNNPNPPQAPMTTALPTGKLAADPFQTPGMATAATGGDSVVTDGPTKPLPKLDFALPPLESDQLPDVQVPGMAEALANIQKNVLPEEIEKRLGAVKYARTELNRRLADQRRQRTVDENQAQIDMAKIELEYKKRTYVGSTNIPSEAEIRNDPRLQPQGTVRDKHAVTAIDNLTRDVDRVMKADPAAPMNATNERELDRRIALNWGAEGKINTPDVIKDWYHAGWIDAPTEAKLLTRLSNTLNRGEGGESQMEKEKNTLKAHYRLQILGTAGMSEILHSIDATDATESGKESADMRLQRFHTDLESAIAKSIEGNQDWRELFNPESPRYFGKNIGKYTPNVAQETALKQSILDRPDLTKMTKEQLTEYAKQNITKNWDAAFAEGVRRGYWPGPTPAAPSQVPVR